VLRHGRVAAAMQRPFDRDVLLQAMFDSLPTPQAPPEKRSEGPPILEFFRVRAGGSRSGLPEVSITIRAGEVVGLAGIEGSGQSVFLKIAYGLLQPESGYVLRFGVPLKNARKVPGTTTVFLPADRLTEGLFPGMTIREHHLLAAPGSALVTKSTGLADTRRAIAMHSIKGQPETPIDDLSGGNQQRLLLSLIPSAVQLILMENPTRGLDVQSSAWTWRHLHQRLKGNGAIVFASPDLEELMCQANRILVFYNGKIVLDTPTEETDYQRLSQAITGHLEPVGAC